MSIVVFAGPTLSEHEAGKLLPGAAFRGPAACGDIRHAVQQRPRAIALIDGFFDHRLSVWHKEILWALSQGVRVYGAASMGALRAAELDSFGMVGVGAVYAAFRDGVLEDDDEVAVAHETQQRGYRPVSDAMVNLRATLAHASAEGALTRPREALLVERLKQLFYPHRSAQRLGEIAREVLGAEEHGRFDAWLQSHGVTDQKGDDARQLLRRLREESDRGTWDETPLVPSFVFQVTDAWQALCSTLDESSEPYRVLRTDDKPRPVRNEPAPFERTSSAPSSARPAADDPDRQERDWSTWLEQLRHQEPAVHAEVMRRAAERALALLIAERNEVGLEPSMVQAASEKFRRSRGLLTPAKTTDWLARNQLDISAFSLMIHDDLLVEELAPLVHRAVLAQVPPVLRGLDQYPDVWPPVVGDREGSNEPVR